MPSGSTPDRLGQRQCVVVSVPGEDVVRSEVRGDVCGYASVRERDGWRPVRSAARVDYAIKRTESRVAESRKERPRGLALVVSMTANVRSNEALLAVAPRPGR